MKSLLPPILSVYKSAQQLGGVLTTSDIANLANLNDPIKIDNFIKRLIKEGVVQRYIRGVYVIDKYSSEILAAKICPNSYLSLGTVLSKSLVIGSVPAKTIYAVRVGRNQEFNLDDTRIKYFGISQSLFLGWYVQGGIRYATPEKAFLDLLYFYQKGFKPSFDIYSDLNLEDLNQDKVSEYLKNYNNPKFIKFVLNILGDYR